MITFYYYADIMLPLKVYYIIIMLLLILKVYYAATILLLLEYQHNILIIDF